MKKSSSVPTGNSWAIPEEQWCLPVGFSPDGKEMFTLQDVFDHSISTLSLNDLPMKKRVELVAKRIEAQPKFEIATIDRGVISKKQALDEVRSQSSIGRNLMEIEQRLIYSLFDQVKKLGSKNGEKSEENQDSTPSGKHPCH